MKNLIYVLFISFIIQGCAAMKIAIEHQDLEITTRMSSSIFLELTDSVKKTVYIDIKNTSDKEIEVYPAIKKAVEGRGYKVVSDFKDAFYFLRGNILFVGKIDPTAAESALLNGFGGGLAGVAIGNQVGGTGAMVGLGLLGMATEMIANSMVRNVTYSIITDLQISERSDHKIIQSIESKFSQGDTQTHRSQVSEGTTKGLFKEGNYRTGEEEIIDKGTIIKQKSEITTNRRKYRTRILSTANQVNLKFEEAKLLLEQNLARSISGIF